MTSEAVYEFASASAGWCHAQADIVWYRFDPLGDGARVEILWRDGHYALREFTASEVRTMNLAEIAAVLEAMAASVKEPDLPVADPGQPPRNARNLGYANYPIEPEDPAL